MMTQQAKSNAIRVLFDAIVSAVKEAGPAGVPAGTVYAFLMSRISLAQFEGLMAAIVAQGYLRKSGQLYIFVRDVEV